MPGEGGSVPDIAPFVANPNQIAGLKVDQCSRENDFFGSGTRPILDMSFPAPSTVGATTYQLQRSLTGISSWQNVPGFTTTGNNFSFNPDGSYSYRLLVQGGPKNGYTSNVAAAPLSSVDTRFAGWGLDESMSITGVMWPWLGRGITATFTAHKLSDDSDVTSGLSYKWYRVNPMTYEMTPVAGVTGLTYVTSEADLGGYLLLCRATGNETTAGGFCQVMTSKVLVPNEAYATKLTANGFRLNLYKSVPSLVPADLQLTYWDGTQTVTLPITAVTPLTGNASFDIAVSIPSSAQQLMLSNNSPVWSIATKMIMGDLMQFLSITVPPDGFKPEIAVQQPTGTDLVDGTASVVLGNVVVGKSGTAKKFTIRNKGTSDLTGLVISKTGANAANYQVAGPVATTVAPGMITSFTVTFSPTAKGTRVADIHIASNDSNENPFDINLTGTALAPAPEIRVEQPAGSIMVDGTAKRSFGTVSVGKTGTAKTFTIKNTGTADLTGLAVSRNGLNAGDFIVTAPAQTTLPPGASTTFKVSFKPLAKGSRTAAIHIKSNDADENPFDINLAGFGG